MFGRSEGRNTEKLHNLWALPYVIWVAKPNRIQPKHVMIRNR